MRFFVVLMALAMQLCLVRAQNNPSSKALDGYQIPLTLTPLTNCWVYLGNYYGRYSQVVDSA